MTRPNGSITRRNGQWCYVFSYDDNGKRRQKRRQGFATKDLAQRALVAELSKIHQNATIDSTDTVAQYLTAWLDRLSKSGTVKRTTVVARTGHLVRYVIPRIGQIQLNKLKPQHVAALYADLMNNGRINNAKSSGLSAKSVRDIGSTLVKALNDAVKFELLNRNVAKGVELPRYEKPDITPYDESQVRQLLEHARMTGDYFAPIWRLLIVSGMRRGELCGLKWSDVDMANGTITISETRLNVDGQILVESPKTRQSRRTVSLDAGTIDELAKFRNLQNDAKIRLGSWHSAYVLTDLDGQPVNPDRVSRLFKRACANAGLPVPRLHDTRHTAVTLGISSGVPIHVVAGRVGHANVTTTLNTYSHFLPRADKLAADVIGAAVSEPVNLDAAETRAQLNDQTVTKRSRT